MTTGAHHFLAMRVGEFLVGISADLVHTVVSKPSYTPVPLTAEFILGITNYNGHIVTVIDTGACLHLTPVRNRDNTTGVVTECNGDWYMFIVDYVGDVHVVTPPFLSADNLKPSWKPFTMGTHLIGNELMALMDGNLFIKELLRT